MARKRVAFDANAKNPAPSPAKNTAPSSVQNRAPPSAPDNPASSPAKNTAPSSGKNTATPSATDAAAPFKNKTPSSVKKTALASSKNTRRVPAKSTSSASGKNKGPASVKVPAASDEDEVAAPPEGTPLRAFINFMCEKATSSSRWWQGLLDAFLTWVYGRAGHDTSEASSGSDTDGVESSEEEKNVAKDAPSQGSIHEEQKDKRKEQRKEMYLGEMKKTEKQASPQLPEESRRKNYAHMYGHDREKTKADHSVRPSINQQTALHTDETKASHTLPVDPSTSQIVEDDRYFRSAIQKRYIELMSECQARGETMCAACFFDLNERHIWPQSYMIRHFGEYHGSDGVQCKNCTARFRLEHHRDLHSKHCNA